MYHLIKKIFIDVDGTLTDGKYTISESGEVSKSFFTRDFYAISEVVKLGLQVIILSQAYDGVMRKRLEKLKNASHFWDISQREGRVWLCTAEKEPIHHKFTKIEKEFLGNSCIGWEDVSWDNIAYIGDAENDLECIEAAAVSGCPIDATIEVREKAMWVSNFKGGEGAVYDFCMELIKKINKECHRDGKGY